MRWEELKTREIDELDRHKTIVVLPLGAVEQHGNHMPVGTDSILAHEIALAAAKKAGDVIVLPVPWYGFSAHHMQFSGSISLRVETLMDIVEDIVGSVITHGFSRVILVNGHGGNNGAIDVLASTLGHRHNGKARIAALTYFQLARDAIAKLRLSEVGGMGHAGEFETALMLHLRPELVDLTSAAICYPDPGSSFISTDLLGATAVRTYLNFGDISSSGTFGDPSYSSPELGSKYFTAVVEQLTKFYTEFRGWPITSEKP